MGLFQRFFARSRPLIVKGKWVALVVIVVLLLGGGYVLWNTKSVESVTYQTPEEKDVYVRFDMEVFDTIEKNFWMKPEDLKTPELFRLSLEKAGNTKAVLATPDREGTARMLGEAFKNATSSEARKNLALNIAAVVLYNLPPAGRNGILSKTEEVALRQNVSNIDSSKDLYQNLGLQKGASAEAVAAAYKEKVSTLTGTTTDEGKQALMEAEYANKVLAQNTSKQLYDQSGIEPTLVSKVFGTTLYVHMSKISPTTLQEFAIAVDSASSTPNLSSLVIDVRGNIGGALDFLPTFYGLFVGANQYVFDLFQQGNYEVIRSPQGAFEPLARYKEIAILTDEQTQSTAELMTATFKKFNRAHSVGTKTRGWGTVENTYPISSEIDPNTSYALLLVNSLTLREDNQPIEGRGVDPDIDTSVKGWESKLGSFFSSPSLIKVVKERAGSAPLK
ncbi:hypothetical protein EPO56_00450 [Patescibacteria group bacterium]|nr:MAG: hypothetical protein EPO56_00450 [Patescibacteria group bacterium]